MESFFSIFLSLLLTCLGFVVVTWFWWVTSRKFFIFLLYFSEDKLKIKKKSWQKILFKYGIFGPLGLVGISGYIYCLLLFFKFSIF